VILLDALTERLFAERPEVGAVRASIKQTNEASRRAFEAAGYVQAGSETIHETAAWLYIKTRPGRGSVA
jgi:RimJ/RimL family protein N-acetyltransferase